MSTEKITDPRLMPDFDAAYLPLCDGGPVPQLNSDNLHSDRMIEFASIYYAMNRAMDAAQAAKSGGDALAEQEALRKVCRLSVLRDALEDRYAPQGFLAEPLLSEGLYVNILFTWSGKSDRVLCVQRFEAEIVI